MNVRAEAKSPSPSDYFLPFSNHRTDIILGHGRGSTAFLIDQKRACVLRAGFETAEQAEIVARKLRGVEREICPRMGIRSIEANYLVVGSQNDGYAIAKTKSLVPGVDTGNMHLVEILSNKTTVDGMAQIMALSAKLFFDTGYFPNLIGHHETNSIGEWIKSRFPYRSGNIRVDYRTGEAKLIDCEVDPNEWNWKITKSFKQKARIIGSLAGVGVSYLIYKTAYVGHCVRDTIVDIVKPKGNSTETAIFAKKFAETIAYLEESKISYRVLGSTALSALTKSDFSSRRPDGTWRDIDLVVLETTDCIREKVSRLSEQCDLVSATIVGDNVNGTCKKVGRFLPSFVGKMAKDKNGNLYRVYREISQEMGGDLDPVEAEFMGTKFKTVRLSVLAGLYITRIGYFHLDDQEKMREVFKKFPYLEIEPNYLQMAEDIRERYPEDYRNAVLRDSLNYWTNNFPSKILALMLH